MDRNEFVVQVRAPSRLHFGLLAFGGAAPRDFGGVGVMIERPATELAVARASRPGEWSPQSPAEGRAREFLQRFSRSLEQPEQRAFVSQLRVQVQHAAPAHAGLGSGTQLALAVARALSIWTGQSEMPPEELARRVGRGTRSAIGVHGFNCGGFLVEGGKRGAAEIAPLVARLNFPPEWHWLLIVPSDSKGLHGTAEREAFEGLAAMDERVTADLCRLVLLGLLPAVAERDLESFSEALFEFGHKVGQCFAPCQGGVYASPLAPQIIDYLRSEGVRGIAQSSWGPTLAAITESRFRAEWLAARLPDVLGTHAAQILTSPPNNLGAKTEVVEAAG